MMLAPALGMMLAPVLGMMRIAALLALLIGGWPLVVQARPVSAGTWLGSKVQKIKVRVDQWKSQRSVTRRLRKIDPLLVKAYRARQHAHAPYSGCKVGAAISMEREGLPKWLFGLRSKSIAGFNSESHGDLQICAERSAMARLPRGLAKRHPVKKIAVVAEKRIPIPCGRCLQVLSEVGTSQTEIVSANLKGQHRRFTLGQLLPADFGAAGAGQLKPYRPLIAQAVRSYRLSLKHGINGYRPAAGAVVQTDTGDRFVGIVIKNTASTFTPATQLPLDQVAQTNALTGRRSKVQTVAIAGRGSAGSGLPVPTADERQHLIDMNPEATVILYNPHLRAGAVLEARDLLPHVYDKGR
jgi:cytidine deaminase